jgi:hypothetical protein
MGRPRNLPQGYTVKDNTLILRFYLIIIQLSCSSLPTSILPFYV